MLGMNVVYGLGLVVLHAELLGTGDRKPHWFVQLADLDFSWGHGLLGFDDFPCLVCGLIYGVAVLLGSSFALHEIFDKDRRPQLWFIVFGHVELFLFGAIALAKSPWLCKLRLIRYPDLEAHCDVLRFTFLWRQFINVLVASFALWVVTSFSRVDMVDGDVYGGIPRSSYVESSPAKYRVASTRPMTSGNVLSSLPDAGFRSVSLPMSQYNRPVSSRHLVTTPMTSEYQPQTMLRPQSTLAPSNMQPQSMSFATGGGLRPPVAVY